MRNEQFNKYRPIIPQSKVWQVKSTNQLVGLVGLPISTSLTTEQLTRSIYPLVKQKDESVDPISAPCDEEPSLTPSV